MKKVKAYMCEYCAALHEEDNYIYTCKECGSECCYDCIYEYCSDMGVECCEKCDNERYSKVEKIYGKTKEDIINERDLEIKTLNNINNADINWIYKNNNNNLN